ncbi:MAG: peptide chain release factor 2 [Candidatus Muiribacteriota bacterium]
MLEEIILAVRDYKEEILKLRSYVDLPELKNTIKSLEKESTSPDFWNNQEEAKKTLNSLNNKKETLAKIEELEGLYEEIIALIEILEEEKDKELQEELMQNWKELKQKYKKFEIELLLSGEYDNNNCYISLHPGAGGTESQDWCAMLSRMYQNWAEKNNYKVDIIDFQPGEVAGIKSITMHIKGFKCYGYLKCEKGVHRLVRISPFDSSGRRHTSFASVDVTPEFEDLSHIEIDEKELRIDTYRSTGAGGQHVNTTDSAVRITHIPTKIVVQCQKERSQIKNRETAMKMLQAKLMQDKIEKQKQKLSDIQGEQKEIGWGSQIRSYILQPYQMIKDHRTNLEKGNVQDILDGNIDEFIQEVLIKENS